VVNRFVLTESSVSAAKRRRHSAYQSDIVLFGGEEVRRRSRQLSLPIAERADIEDAEIWLKLRLTRVCQNRERPPHRYREQFGFRKSREHGYRIGYAFSHDLMNWTRDDENAGIDVSADGWDSEMQCYPSVFACDHKTYLLYNGNEFGRLGFGLAVAET
jgi:hypothetical protein